MDSNIAKIIRRTRRKHGIRKNVFGVPARPRLTVFRSLKHIYGQVVDDLSGKTLASASSRESGFDAVGGNADGAKKVGEALAKRAKDAGIDAVVFDRNGFRFHGRVKALANADREGGLKF